MAGVVTFLNLAYMVEVSIVLNLAYKEFKFPNLHKELLDKVSEVEIKAEKSKITADESIELRMIQGLANHDGKSEWSNSLAFANLAKEKEEKDKSLKKMEEALRCKDIEAVGREANKSNSKKNKFKSKLQCFGLQILQFFFFRFIKPGVAVTVTNWFVFYNVILLLLFTSFSSVTLDFDLLSNWHLFVFFSSGIAIAIFVFCASFIKEYFFKTFLFHALFVGTISIFMYISEDYSFSYEEYWAIAFGILCFFTILPMLFIRLSTSCSDYLFGIIKYLELMMVTNSRASKKSETVNRAASVSLEGNNKE